MKKFCNNMASSIKGRLKLFNKKKNFVLNWLNHLISECDKKNIYFIYFKNIISIYL